MAGNARIQINYDKVYQSNSCGPFKIIKDLGRDERSRLYVKIRFLDTGSEYDVRYDIAVAGKVNDELYGIDFNTIYDSYYYGPYKIIAYLGRDGGSKKIVRIRFLNTGYEYDVQLRMAQLGKVKDYTVKQENRVFNISEEEKRNKYLKEILKGRWIAMIARCYNQNCPGYADYGALGVTVCEEWHDFETFYNSMPYILNYDKFCEQPQFYQLDKDLLQYNIPVSQRVYSMDTCIFLNMADNANLSIFENKYQRFHGVKETSPGHYSVEFAINGKKHRFGVYSDLNAALNEYNYYYNLYSNSENIKLLNTDIEPMDHETSLQYLVNVPTASTK